MWSGPAGNGMSGSDEVVLTKGKEGKDKGKGKGKGKAKATESAAKGHTERLEPADEAEDIMWSGPVGIGTSGPEEVPMRKPKGKPEGDAKLQQRHAKKPGHQLVATSSRRY